MESATPANGTSIHYLEMTDRGQFLPKPAPPELRAHVLTPPRPELNRHFYREVGRDWKWTDRLIWTDDQWQRYATRPQLTTWVGQLDPPPPPEVGTTNAPTSGEARFEDLLAGAIGYFELDQRDTEVQIAYFGLLPNWIGRGLGGAFLSRAIEAAWALPGTTRVWLHTCTDDHPRALDNYRRRGLQVYRTSTA